MYSHKLITKLDDNEIKEEIYIYYDFDPNTAVEQINRLKEEIEKIKYDQKIYAIESKRLGQVSKIRAQSIQKQRVSLMITKKNYYSTGQPARSSIILLRHQLENELALLTSSNASHAKISRKKAQILNLMDI